MCAVKSSAVLRSGKSAVNVRKIETVKVTQHAR